MKDIIVIAIVIGFFALCAAYVTWCERVLAADAPDRLASDAGRSARNADVTDVNSPDAAVVTVRGLHARRR